MNAPTLDRYHDYRRRGIPAASALRQARSVTAYREEHAEAWDLLRLWNPTHEEHTEFDLGDYRVRVRYEPDYDTGPDGKFTDKWTPDCVEVARIVGPDEWPAEGRDRRLPYYERVTGTYASDRRWFLRHNYRKADADLLAREYERLDVLAAVEHEALCMVVVVALAGIDLGTASLCGLDYRADDWHDETTREWLRETALDLVDEALHDAQDSAARLCAALPEGVAR